VGIAAVTAACIVSTAERLLGNDNQYDRHKDGPRASTVLPSRKLI
jgi:hypothetical protein